MWEALGRRLRRNYIAIFFVMILVWVFKNLSQPTTISTWDEFVVRASIGPLEGTWVLVLLESPLRTIGLAIGTLGLQQATAKSSHLFSGMIAI